MRERTSLASRPLRISFTVTDIRHGQRSSSNRRRRNRERERDRKKVRKGRGTRRAKRQPTRSTCTRAIFFVLSLSPPLPPPTHSSPTPSIVSTQHPTSREKAHTGANRLFLFNGRGQNKLPPTATPISSRHAERDLEHSSITQPVLTCSCETRPSSKLRAFVRKIHE